MPAWTSSTPNAPACSAWPTAWSAAEADAEDVVQEAWLRWSAADRDAIVNPPAWLTTVTTRLALDRIREVERRRETYVGPWLPDPISTERSPEEHTELAESLTLGFLVVLDELSPVERAVLLLADVFGEPFSVIAPRWEKARRRAARSPPGPGARSAAVGEDPVPGVSGVDGAGGVRAGAGPRRCWPRLMIAFTSGDEARVVQLLDPDVVLVTDAGPNRHAARRPVLGVYRVGRLLTNLARRIGVLPAGWPPSTPGRRWCSTTRTGRSWCRARPATGW